MSSHSMPASAQPASGEPALVYRVTGALNRLLWRVPLPRRILVRLSTILYRNPPMPAETVLCIVEALQEAGVTCWISGGWGVDALAGRRTRTHRDLDLIVDAQNIDRALEVLGNLGYWEWYRTDSDVPLFSRVVVHDHELAGRAIDLHPVEISDRHVSLATGTIEGRMVGCLSLMSQLTAHSRYKKRWFDRADLSVLRRLLDCSVTALIVPVRAVNGLVDRSARDAGMPAHVTLIYPFLAGRAIDHDTELALASLIGETPGFDFTMAQTGRFPGVVYLAPEPAAPFVELTEALARRWPECPPYGGAYEEIVPHLTVANADDPPAGLAKRLPVDARADEVWLMVRIAARWVRRARFPLGASLTGTADPDACSAAT
jgi:2'-5' RNA ligase superfamily protein/aminoglycoside-2''-adenylyltransferase